MENQLFEVEKETPVYNYSDPLVWREAHRIMELLRFSPDANGVFTARCAPDNYVLPALKPYFMARFIEMPWAIIDEKRGLCLLRKQGEKPQIIEWKETAREEAETDEWEKLWKHYHKTINNEDRHNPKLQKQLMPQRYWKYLPEIENKE
ncbi:MAG: TIGR03915 family putative DNA repair protein [Treponema sp.]|nr:TIGR03915 family putative DNA repair protein [Treponema sp.]MCL2237137.1 TIGR03915 family putative DNA repair protein [Treponema sp.]